MRNGLLARMISKLDFIKIYSSALWRLRNRGRVVEYKAMDQGKKEKNDRFAHIAFYILPLTKSSRAGRTPCYQVNIT
tara:strand:+ start:1445 stop:1675 length:231 start_codon:yes stop_codon:yes gene_type:complete